MPDKNTKEGTFSLAPNTRQPIKTQENTSPNTGDVFSLAPTNPTLTGGQFHMGETSQSFRGVDVRDPNFNYKVSQTQSTGEKWLNAAVGGLKLAGAGILDGINQWNLSDAADMMAGVEKDYGSFLHDLSNDIRKNVEKNNPIYEETPGSFNPSDPGWWANQVQQQGYSLGLAAEAFGESALVAALTGGVGEVGTLSTKIPALARLGLNLTQKRLLTQFSFGAFKGLQEGYLNGQMTFEEERDSLLQKGVSPEEATRLASIAASEAYRREAVPSMLLNALQYGLFTYNPVTKTSTSLLENAIKNKVARGAATLGSEMLSEGFEEVYQNIASLEGKHVADKLAGLPVNDNISERLASYLTSDDNWNQFVGGALGGLVFSGLAAGRNRLFRRADVKKQEQQYQDFKNKMQATTFNYFNRIGELRKEGKDEEAEMLTKEVSRVIALGAYHLDHLNDASHQTAFDGHLAFLNNTIDAIDRNDQETLSKLKIEDDDHKQYIKNSFTQMLTDAAQIKDIYDNLKHEVDGAEIMPLAYRMFTLSSLEKMQPKATAKVLAAKAGVQMSNALSENGVSLLDLNHQVTALHAELQRLEDLREQSNSTEDKKHVDELIDSTKQQLEGLYSSIEDIYSNESYDETSQERDEGLLSNSLINQKYIESLAEKAQLDNEVEKLRKELTLLNSPEFKTKLAKQKIEEARSRADLDKAVRKLQKEASKKKNKVGRKVVAKATEKDIAEPEVESEGQAISEQVYNKEQEILSNEEAEDKSVTPLGKILMADDNSDLETVAATQSTSTEIEVRPNSRKETAESIRNAVSSVSAISPEELASIVNDDELFASPLSKEEEGRGVPPMRDYIESLSEELGHQATFEEFIKDFITNVGKDTARSNYQGLTKVWEASGYAPSDYKGIYTKFFADRKQLGLELVDAIKQEVAEKDVQVEEVQQKLEEVVQEQENTPVGFNGDNKPIYNHSGITTDETRPKMAFISRLARKVVTPTGEGVAQVSYEYLEEDLHQGDYVDSLSLLDPDRFYAGTSLVIEKPDNFLDIKVSVYDENGVRLGAVPFGQYVAERNLSPTDQEYRDKVPLIIKDDKGVPVALVHDVQWYHGSNFLETVSDINQAVQNTRNVRAKVLNGDNKAIVTSKSVGTFEALKIKNEDGTAKYIPISEAAPEAVIAVGSKIGTSDEEGVILQTGRGQRLKLKVVNTHKNGVNQVVNGEAYNVRRWGLDENGEPTYIMFPVNTPLLSQEAQTSFLKALEIYLFHQSNAPHLPAMTKAAEEVKAKSGIDVRTREGIEQYLTQFASVFTPKFKLNTQAVVGTAEQKAAIKAENAKKIQAMINHAASSSFNKRGNKFFFFFEGDSIILGNTQQPISGKTSLFNISPSGVANNAMAASMAHTMLEVFKTQVLPSTFQGKSLRVMSENKPVVHIDENGFTNVAYANFQDYLKGNLNTNIRSVAINTPTGKKWVTSVQPVITYEMESSLSQLNSNEKKEEEQKNVLEEATTSTSTLTPTDTPSIEDINGYLDALNEDNSWLEEGDDSPLSEEQVSQIVSSVRRIPGINPSEQQYFVDFIYNQIQSLVDFESKEKISKEEISKAIRKAYDEIIPKIREQKLAEKSNLEEILRTSAEKVNADKVRKIIAQTDKILAKINSLEEAYTILEDEAYEKVLKYTGISEGQIEEENDSAEEGEDGDNGSDAIIKKDALQEDGKATSSYRLKRFFAGIQAMKNEVRKDKDGNEVIRAIPETKFMNLPSYIGFDAVFNTTRAILADTPADYNVMLAKLRDVVEAHPWVSNLIQKLEGASQQIKNEFVSTMSSHSLNMEFVMYSFNRKTGKYGLKVYNTNANAITTLIQKNWIQNFKKSSLVIVKDGKYAINVDKARELSDIYNSWTDNTPAISDSLTLKEFQEYFDLVKKNPTGAILSKPITNTKVKEVLDSKLGGGKKIKIAKGTSSIFIEKAEGGRYKLTGNNKVSVSREQIADWLEAFGIKLSDQTLRDLMKVGMYHGSTKIPFQQVLFDPNAKRDANGRILGSTQTDSLFGLLNSSLEYFIQSEGQVDIDGEVEGKLNPLAEGVVKSLAAMESKYNVQTIANSFRDGSKSIYGFTANKFITERVEDLKTSPDLLQQLRSTSFSSESFWLRLLLENPTFKDKFDIVHLGLTAFKQLGKKNYGDNGITALADSDHELTRLGMFQDTRQGEVTSSFGIPLRIARVFSPTMSDKSTMTVLKTAVFNLTRNFFTEELQPRQEVIELLYNQIVRPELKRMTSFYGKVKETTIKNYDKGAGMFLMLPELNTLAINQEGLTLRGAISQNPTTYTLEHIENQYLPAIHSYLRDLVGELVADKLEVWKRNGYLDGSNIKFLDSDYLASRSGKNAEENIAIAAADYVINDLIANANSFMTIAGDPAIYYKKEHSLDITDPSYFINTAKDTFTNIGKRLANQIAPGTKLANSINENYLQIFLQDRVSTANNIEYLERLLGKDGAKDYRNIEGTDAQEYTTWKEHLHVLEQLGKLPDVTIDITPEELREAREIFSSEKDLDKLSEKQRKTINKVLQPMKPVYTGQHYSADNDLMRVVYIKSSSFPLIPQLTKGLEIDKLREAMEKLEESSGKTIRASYQTANKVGSTSKPANIFNKDGGVGEITPESLLASSMILDRKNFRIQQDVPYKSAKRKNDTITLGTQTMKLLFGDGILNIAGFKFLGKEYSGKELYQKYNDLFGSLINLKKKQLYEELGLKEDGQPIDELKTAKKLQSILNKEAIGRGYSKQTIDGLELDENGKFIIPLWSSANSDKYESLLLAIVTNRLAKIKMPGNSFVVGSEEGFKYSNNISDIKDASRIVFTKAWDGSKGLQAAFTKDGSLQKAQVLVPSKFRDSDGNLIDLFQKKGTGEYMYIEETPQGWRLKEDMIDPKLLSLTSFRIPTSGHMSMSQIEIVGFIPAESGDLIITPRNFTKQMGQDFDIDKLNTYQYWHTYDNKTGKIGLLQGDFTKESGVQERLLHNAIVGIHEAVLSHPSDEVQKKIQRTLSIDFAREQAELIDGLVNEGQKRRFVPLSGEYQKAKMALGAAGKVGTGAYSLDVVGHSLFQQIALANPERALQLMEEYEPGKPVSKRFTFGNYTSNGRLGNVVTLDGDRTIAEVLAERQNIAVDNEKEQIMGRVNLNGFTLDVDKVFNLIGFDKGEDGNSISLLFLSQPILKDYVEMMKNSRSNIADFAVDREEQVIAALKAKYGGSENLEEYSGDGEIFTNAAMLSELKSDKPDGFFQIAILNRFLEMKMYGENIKSIQTTINVDSKGIGKSYFDLLSRIDKITGLPKLTLVRNSDAVVGDYLDNYEDGAVRVGDLWIKPTTVSGHFAVQTVATAHTLWQKHFPYDDVVMREQFSEIINILAGEDTKDRKKIELKQEVLREMKKFLFSKVSLGLFDAPPQSERAILFMDREGNESLASYILGLKNSKDNSIRNIITSNRLLTRLEPEIAKPGVSEASILKFNNTASEDFDEEYLSMALTNLIEINKPLPSYNGQEYTTRNLAQDLIKYAYLEGGVQQAIQFVKHVPVSYLKAVGFSEGLRKVNFNIHNIFGLSFASKSLPNAKYMVSRFTRQYAQHNPQRMPKLEDSSLTEANSPITSIEYIAGEGKTWDNVSSFELKDEVSPKVFLSVYDITSKNKNKFHLYQFDGVRYNKIPVLGQFGMSEYQIGSAELYPSLVNTGVSINEVTQTVPTERLVKENSKPDYLPFSLETGDITKIIDSIANLEGPLGDIAKVLRPYIDSSVGVTVEDLFKKYGRKSAGKYFRQSHRIEIHNNISNQEVAAKAILHETIHSLLVNYMNQWISPEGVVSQDAPSSIKRLDSLFQHVKKSIGQDKIDAVLAKFESGGQLTQEEKYLIYPGKNIHEFIAIAMTEPAFQQYLDTIKYPGATEMTLWDKFKAVVQAMLRNIIPGLTQESSASQAIASILEILEEKNTPTKPVNSSNFVLGIPLAPSKEDMNLLDKTKDLGNMKEVRVQMQPDNVAKIVAGTKTTTIRSARQAEKIGLRPGESGIVTFNGKQFKITNRGKLTIQQAGGKEVMIKSEGLNSESEFKYQQSKDWVNGKGELYVYDIKPHLDVEDSGTRTVEAYPATIEGISTEFLQTLSKIGISDDNFLKAENLSEISAYYSRGANSEVHVEEDKLFRENVSEAKKFIDIYLKSANGETIEQFAANLLAANKQLKDKAQLNLFGTETSGVEEGDYAPEGLPALKDNNKDNC